MTDRPRFVLIQGDGTLPPRSPPLRVFRPLNLLAYREEAKDGPRLLLVFRRHAREVAVSLSASDAVEFGAALHSAGLAAGGAG